MCDALPLSSLSPRLMCSLRLDCPVLTCYTEKTCLGSQQLSRCFFAGEAVYCECTQFALPFTFHSFLPHLSLTRIEQKVGDRSGMSTSTNLTNGTVPLSSTVDGVAKAAVDAVTTTTTLATTTVAEMTTTAAASGGGLSGGAIAGIVIGIIVFLLLVAAGVFFTVRFLRQRRKNHGEYRPHWEENHHAKDLPYLQPPTVGIEGLI